MNEELSSKKTKLTIIEITKFAMMGAIMYGLKASMAPVPNIEPVSLFVLVFAAVYRVKALYPIYLYVLLEGIFGGFTVWWMTYLYVWVILWGAAMLLPRDLHKKWYGVMIYMAVLGLYGLLFGTFTSPLSFVYSGPGLDKWIAWIIAGLPYDAIHGAGNFFIGLLAVPLIRLLLRLEKSVRGA